MGQITLNADATINAGTNIAIFGAPDLDSALSDADITTFAAMGFGSDGGGSQYGTGEVSFADASGLIPPGAVVKQIRTRADLINVSAINNGDGSYAVGGLYRQVGWATYFEGVAFSAQNQIIDIGTAVNINGPWLQRKPSNNQPWSPTDVNNLRGRVGLRSPNTASGTEVANLYHLLLDVEYNERPVVNLLTPAPGLFEVSAPLVSWDYTDPENDAQQSFEIKIFTQAQYSAGGFSPDTSAPYATSGRVFSQAARSWQSTALPNGNYRVYVRAWQTPIVGQDVVSAWDSADINLVALDIAPPTIAVVPSPYSDDFSTYLQLMGGMNLLPLDSSAAEQANQWGIVGPATSALDVGNGNAHSGTGSAKITSTGAGSVTAFSFATTTLDTTKIGNNRLLRCRVWVKPTVTRTISIGLYLQTAASVNVYAAVDITGVSCPANQWTELSTTAAVASGVLISQARAVIIWQAAGAGEVTFVDDASIAPAQVRIATYDPTNDSFFEATAGGWVALANAHVPVRQTGTVYMGAGALQMQATAAGTMKVRLYTPGSGVAIDVRGGSSWKLRAILRGTAGRAVYLGYTAYDKNGVQIFSEDGASIGALGSPNATWNVYERNIVIPSTAIAIYPHVAIAGMGAAEIAYMDNFVVFERVDTTTAWGRGGLWDANVPYAATPTYQIQASYDDGVTWADLPWVTDAAFSPSSVQVDAFQESTLRDYAIPPNTPTQYRARAIADVAGGQLVSPWGYSSIVSVDFVGGVLKDPFTGNAVHITLEEPFSRQRVEPMAVHYPLGRDAALVVSEGQKGHTFDFTTRTLSADEREEFEAVLAQPRPLVLVNTLGERWWVKILDGTEAQIVKAAPAQGDLYPIRDFYRFTLRAVETLPAEG